MDRKSDKNNGGEKTDGSKLTFLILLNKNMDDQNQKIFMDELGLSGISREKQEELLVKMTEVLLKRIFIETMEKLPETDQNQYAEIIENKAAPDQVEAFLKEKIPNYDEIVKKVVEDFKEEMKS
jgi:hypothetical protein